ncbi:hypothetical protein EBZ39_16240 [bacterium]|nr:hypothetical protein [bacterium]
MVMYKSPFSGIQYSQDVQLEFTILPNDKLRITLAAGCDRLALDLALQTAKENQTAVDLWREAIENYLGNGWGNPTPEDIGALTSDPYLLTDDYTVEDDGEVIVGRVWHFPDYMIACPLERILEYGEVIFPLAPDAPVAEKQSGTGE